MNAVLDWLSALFGRFVPKPAEVSRAPAFNPTEMSGQGRRWLAGWEEYRERPYLDAAGVMTWGIGHAARPGEVPPTFLTYEEALRLFGEDLRPREAAVCEAVRVVLLQHEFDALLSFAFNVGVPAFERSKLLAALNAGDRRSAAAEFGRWVHAGGAVLPGLVRRRQAERDCFERAAYWGP